MSHPGDCDPWFALCPSGSACVGFDAGPPLQWGTCMDPWYSDMAHAQRKCDTDLKAALKGVGEDMVKGGNHKGAGLRTAPTAKNSKYRSMVLQRGWEATGGTFDVPNLLLDECVWKCESGEWDGCKGFTRAHNCETPFTKPGGFSNFLKSHNGVYLQQSNTRGVQFGPRGGLEKWNIEESSVGSGYYTLQSGVSQSDARIYGRVQYALLEEQNGVLEMWGPLPVDCSAPDYVKGCATYSQYCCPQGYVCGGFIPHSKWGRCTVSEPPKQCSPSGSSYPCATTSEYCCPTGYDCQGYIHAPRSWGECKLSVPTPDQCSPPGGSNPCASHSQYCCPANYDCTGYIANIQWGHCVSQSHCTPPGRDMGATDGCESGNSLGWRRYYYCCNVGFECIGFSETHPGTYGRCLPVGISRQWSLKYIHSKNDGSYYIISRSGWYLEDNNGAAVTMTLGNTPGSWQEWKVESDVGASYETGMCRDTLRGTCSWYRDPAVCNECRQEDAGTDARKAGEKQCDGKAFCLGSVMAIDYSKIMTHDQYRFALWRRNGGRRDAPYRYQCSRGNVPVGFQRNKGSARFEMRPTTIMIPSEVTPQGSATNYAFSEIIIMMGAGITISPLQFGIKTYTYYNTGRSGSRTGPEHTAKYIFAPDTRDHTGALMESRTYTNEACYTDKSNYFAGHKRTYGFTISGSIECCLIFFCFDIVNGWILPWDAK